MSAAGRNHHPLNPEVSAIPTRQIIVHGGSGQYGIDGLYIGVPAIIGAGGIERIAEVKLEGEDKVGFDKSVAAVNGLLEAVTAIAPDLAD